MDLRELYQSVILEHNKRPRNRGRLPSSTHHAEGYNPLCGDMVLVDLQIQDGRVQAVTFDGQGCAISTASASLMTEAIVGKSPQEVKAILEHMVEVLTGKSTLRAEYQETELCALSEVKDFPVRIKCAALPWRTLESALSAQEGQVSTE